MAVKTVRKMELTITFLFLFLILFVASAKAAEISTISTSFEIKKLVDCDRLNMRFKVWAEGDNYAGALKRLKPVSNKFISFLKEIYDSKSIKTIAGYSSSTMASLIVVVNSDKIRSVGKVLNYISNRHFPYKTGITTIELKYTLSDKKEREIKSSIFKEALIKCKNLLEIVNNTLNSKYRIGSINVSYYQPIFIHEKAESVVPLARAKPTDSEFSLPSGQELIKANVRFSAMLPVSSE